MALVIGTSGPAAEPWGPRSGRPAGDGGRRAVALFHHPAHGLRAGAAAAEALELRHRLHRLLDRERSGRDLAQGLRVEPHVAAGHVAVVEVPREVAQVLLDVGERLAIDADHLERDLALAPEEARVRKVEEIAGREPAVRAPGAL